METEVAAAAPAAVIARDMMQNPVYVKEMRAWRHMPMARRIRVFYGGAMALLTLAAIVAFVCGAWGVIAPIYTGVCWVELAAALILPPILASGAISKEREVNTLEAVIVTGMPPQGIVIGKFMGAAARVGTLILYSLPPLVATTLFGTALGGPTLVHLVVSQLIVVSIVLLYSAVGVFASSLFGRTVYATSAAVVFIVFTIAGVPGLCVLMQAVGAGSGSPEVGAALIVLLAFAAAAIVAFGLFAATVMIIHSSNPGFHRERVWYIMLYGALIITLTALLQFPPVLGQIERMTDPYWGGYGDSALLTRMFSPFVAMVPAAGPDVHGLIRYYHERSVYARYGYTYSGYPYPQSPDVWRWDLDLLPSSLWLIATYLPLAAAVVLLARLRFARTRWRT